MLTDTPQAPINKPLSILLIGPPGGGKTSLMLQFQTLGLLDVIDCDQNLDGPKVLVRRKFAPDLQVNFDPVHFKEDGTPVPIEKCYDRVMEILKDVSKNPAIRFVGVDSLTYLNEFIIRKILTEQGRKTGEMEARDWIPFKSNFYRLLVGSLRGMGKTTICTVHEEKITEPDPKNIMNKILKGYEPSVQGSIVHYFGAFFTDMWRCQAQLIPGGKLKYTVQTCRTTLCDLKNSMNMPAEIDVTDQGIKALLPYMKGRV